MVMGGGGLFFLTVPEPRSGRSGENNNSERRTFLTRFCTRLLGQSYRIAAPAPDDTSQRRLPVLLPLML
jgi:hypothetical protein